MEKKDTQENDVDPDVLKEMERRLEDLRSGKDTGYTWEQAEAIWKQTQNKKSIHT